MIMKKWMAAVLVILFVCSVVGCGTKDVATDVEVSADTTIVETTESTNEEVVTNEETTDESIASEEATPESTEEVVEEPVEETVEEVVEEATLESTETTTETQTDVLVSVSYTYTDLNETMYAKQSVNVRSLPCKDGEKLGGLNLNDEVRVTGQCVETSWYRIEYNSGIGYVSNNYLAKEKTVTVSNNPENSPSVEPQPTTPQPTQPSSGSGDDLSFSGSLTLPSGITISTLNKFNYAGMVLDGNTSWLGDINSEVVGQNHSIMGQNFDKLNEKYPHSAINVVSSEKIWWRSNLSNATGALTIQKCNDHYKLIITSPCLDSNTAQAMGQVLIDKNFENMAQEALTTLLSAISSTPQEIKNMVCEDLFGTTCIGETTYTKVGDCSIKISYYNFKDGKFEVIYNIK